MQLRHVPTETSWEDVVDHGYIAVYDDAGTRLVRRDGFQHNRKLRQGGARDADAISAIVAEVMEALEKAKTAKTIPSFIESEISTKVEYLAWLSTHQQGAAAA